MDTPHASVVLRSFVQARREYVPVGSAQTTCVRRSAQKIAEQQTETRKHPLRFTQESYPPNPSPKTDLLK